MKILIVLFLCISVSQAVVRYCCYGTSPAVTQRECLKPDNTKCISSPQTVLNSTITTYGCIGDSYTVPSSASTCTIDFCNCPPEAHKTEVAVGWFFGEMRKIMYPIMGIIFAIIWIVLAFIGGGPTEVLLLVVSIIDAIFGILLIFLPPTAYLGLFYVAIGAFTIAVVKHSIGGKFGLYFVIGLTILVFLLTGGLTWIAGGGPFFEEVANSIGNCEDSMNIIDWDDAYWNLDTRCENFALFEGFCVFLLFLVQPIALLALFFQMSGGGHGGGHGGSHSGHGGHGDQTAHSGAPTGTSGTSNT